MTKSNRKPHIPLRSCIDAQTLPLAEALADRLAALTAIVIGDMSAKLGRRLEL